METPTPDADAERSAAPASSRRGPARAGVAGALLGIGAVVGSMMLLTAGAGAQLDDSAPAPVPAAAAEAGEPHEIEIDDFELPEELEAYGACVDEILADRLPDGEDAELDEAELSDEDWEALEADLAVCDEHLPAEILELDEAFEAYDQCLVDNGIDFEELEDEFDEDFEELDGEPIEDVVFVETADGATIVELGDGDATVTITKQGDRVDVATAGDATAETMVWDELDELDGFDDAFAECEDLLPDEDVVFDELGWDDDELGWDDEHEEHEEHDEE